MICITGFNALIDDYTIAPDGALSFIVTFTVIPEPSTLSLIGLGLGGILGLGRGPARRSV